MVGFGQVPNRYDSNLQKRPTKMTYVCEMRPMKETYVGGKKPVYVKMDVKRAGGQVPRRHNSDLHEVDG